MAPASSITVPPVMSFIAEMVACFATCALIKVETNICAFTASLPHSGSPNESGSG